MKKGIDMKSSKESSSISSVVSNLFTLGILLYIIAGLNHQFNLFSSIEDRDLFMYGTASVYIIGMIVFYFKKVSKKDEISNEIKD